jgi:hypothetical protein
MVFVFGRMTPGATYMSVFAMAGMISPATFNW